MERLIKIFFICALIITIWKYTVDIEIKECSKIERIEIFADGFKTIFAPIALSEKDIRRGAYGLVINQSRLDSILNIITEISIDSVENNQYREIKFLADFYCVEGKFVFRQYYTEFIVNDNCYTVDSSLTRLVFDIKADSIVYPDWWEEGKDPLYDK